jgi:LacI family transcriptional regulator
MSVAPLVAVILDAARAYDRLVIGGIAQFVREQRDGRRPGPAWSLYVEEDPLLKLPCLRRWHGQGIIASFDDRRVARAVAGVEIPVVGVGGGYGWHERGGRIPYIYTDNAAIGRLGATHLLACGTPTLAFFGYPPGRTTGWSQERAAAFAAAAAAAGRPCHIFTGRYGDARRWEELQRELTGWLANLPRPLGLMAANDLRARHVLEACRRLGLRVPADVAVLGVDNDQLICELTSPPLSSVDQSARRIGFEAASALDERMQDAFGRESQARDGGTGRGPRRAHRRASPPECVIVPPIGVIARASTDTLASDDPAVVAMLHALRSSPWRKPSAEEIAGRVGLSRASLEQRFRAAVGRTIHEEFIRLRVQRLRALITDSDLPLKTIATRAAFPSLQYMTTFVRRHTGLTPARLRTVERRRTIRGLPDA